MAKLRVAHALEPIRISAAEGLDAMTIARFLGVAVAMIGVAVAAAQMRDHNAAPGDRRVEPPAVLASFRKEDAPRAERVAAAAPRREGAATRVHPADPWWTVLFASSAMAAEIPRPGPTQPRGLGPAPLKITDRWIARPAPQPAPNEQRAASLESHAASDAGKASTGRLVAMDGAEALDGRTLRAGAMTIELGGVDLPAAGAMCTLLSGKSEPCATRAQTQLDLLLRGQSVSCEISGAAGGRTVGRCIAGKYDLAQWLVKQGWLKAQAAPAT